MPPSSNGDAVRRVRFLRASYPFGEDVLAMFVDGGFDIGGIGGHHPYSVAFLVLGTLPTPPPAFKVSGPIPYFSSPLKKDHPDPLDMLPQSGVIELAP
jgi:hypothetical protein